MTMEPMRSLSRPPTRPQPRPPARPAARRPRRVLLAALALLVAGCTADMKPVDLRTLARSTSPNDALACPAGACRAKADFESPSFAVGGAALMDAARRVVAARPRTELVATDTALDQLVFVERSRLFGFPDTIRVQGVPAGAGASVIIYSRSNYGYWDFGVNRARVQALLAALARAAAAIPAGRSHPP